jgi:hypothetical protein
MDTVDPCKGLINVEDPAVALSVMISFMFCVEANVSDAATPTTDDESSLETPL